MVKKPDNQLNMLVVLLNVAHMCYNNNNNNNSLFQTLVHIHNKTFTILCFNILLGIDLF